MTLRIISITSHRYRERVWSCTKVRNFNKHFLEIREAAAQVDVPVVIQLWRALFAWFCSVLQHPILQNNISSEVLSLLLDLLLWENFFMRLSLMRISFGLLLFSCPDLLWLSRLFQFLFFLLVIHKYLLNKTISIKRNKSQSLFQNIPYHFFAESELIFHIKLSFNFSAVVLIKMREVILWS